MKRKVASDRTGSLEGRLYEIDAALTGEKVTLRYDPARPAAPSGSIGSSRAPSYCCHFVLSRFAFDGHAEAESLFGAAA